MYDIYVAAIEVTAKDASPQPDARIGREVIERCAKIADPWPGYPTTEPNTYDIKLSEVDKAVIAVRKEMASKIRALTARDAGECTDPRANCASPTASSPAGSALSQRLPE